MNPQAIHFAADTHPGLKRDHNEDCFAAMPELGLWLVADGVGGHSCGEIASAIVRETICTCVANGESLPAAIEKSHREILARIEREPATAGMGSTVVALLLDGSNYQLSWVGDSRAYLWYPNLRQVSEDHNRASELLASNMISEHEANSHPERHVLTQSLGVSDKMSLSPGAAQGTLAEGEQILLCSDGLSDELHDGLITRILSENSTPQAQVDALLRAALDAGGNDNITAVVIGEPAMVASKAASELETTRNTLRTASEDNRERKFPLIPILFVSALAVAAIFVFMAQ